MSHTPVYLVDGIRSPFGTHGGALSSVRADDLLSHVLSALVTRTKIAPDAPADVIIGCANQAGEDNRNIARQAALLAQLDVSVPGVTVNRLCGSGMQAIIDAARMIQTGAADLVIAGGVEQMSRAPWVLPKADTPFMKKHLTAYDTTLGWRFINPKMKKQFGTLPMGETAERVAQQCNVSREQQDAFALNSQQKAMKGKAAHQEEIIALTIKQKKQSIVFQEDQHPRPSLTQEDLTRLHPVFIENGTVTAGNSSGLNDGACAVLLASESALKKYTLTPKARYVSAAVCGVEPSLMGLGPIPAGKKALAQAGKRASDVDIAEINEAFAAQAIPCIDQLNLDPVIVNPLGGAIALGHPLGASGARITLTLMHQLHRTKKSFGLAAMCIGVGQGIAITLEGLS